MNEYQDKAKSTSNYPKGVSGTLCLALGLTSEAGEVAGAVRRIIRDDGGHLTDSRRNKLLDELGDVYWYLAVLSDKLGFTLNEVAERNVNKLQDRLMRDKIKGEGDNR